MMTEYAYVKLGPTVVTVLPASGKRLIRKLRKLGVQKCKETASKHAFRIGRTSQSEKFQTSCEGCIRSLDTGNRL